MDLKIVSIVRYCLIANDMIIYKHDVYISILRNTEWSNNPDSGYDLLFK